jgi:hypothetical protein
MANMVVLCEVKRQIFNFTKNRSRIDHKSHPEGQKKVAFLTGHGDGNIASSERDGFNRAKQAIEEQNYTVEEIILADKDSIPADVSVMVIAGAEKPLFDKELDMLTKYIENGGSSLFMLDPRPAPGLSDYLKQWKIESATIL